MKLSTIGLRTGKLTASMSGTGLVVKKHKSQGYGSILKESSPAKKFAIDDEPQASDVIMQCFNDDELEKK